MSKNFLLFASTILLVCALISSGIYVYNTGSMQFGDSYADLTQISAIADEYDLNIYNNKVVHGDTVLAAVQQYHGIYEISIMTNMSRSGGVSVEGSIDDSSIQSAALVFGVDDDDATYTRNYKLLHGNTENLMYAINENSEYSAAISRNENGVIVQLNFQQL